MSELIKARTSLPNSSTQGVSSPIEGGGTVRKDVGRGELQGPAFDALLKDTLGSAQTPGASQGLRGTAEKLKFSQHAIDRMQARGIRLNAEEMTKLESAVQKAAAKGSRDSLVLLDNSAWIVSVKNNTIVTVMDRASLKENVFTNIDSTIVM